MTNGVDHAEPEHDDALAVAGRELNGGSQDDDRLAREWDRGGNGDGVWKALSGILGALVVGILLALFARERESMTDARVRQIFAEEARTLVIRIDAAAAATERATEQVERQNDKMGKLNIDVALLLQRLDDTLRGRR